jgi:hypothetical protein
VPCKIFEPVTAFLGDMKCIEKESNRGRGGKEMGSQEEERRWAHDRRMVEST